MPIKSVTAVEDLLKKRGLIERYRALWNKELMAARLTASQRAAILADLDLLSSIDEDLLRLEQLLAGGKSHDRAGNDERREQIMAYLLKCGEAVTLRELCDAFDIPADALRNLMRPLVKSMRVSPVRHGYIALAPRPGTTSTTHIPRD